MLLCFLDHIIAERNLKKKRNRQKACKWDWNVNLNWYINATLIRLYGNMKMQTKNEWKENCIISIDEYLCVLCICCTEITKLIEKKVQQFYILETWNESNLCWRQLCKFTYVMDYNEQFSGLSILRLIFFWMKKKNQFIKKF